MVQAKRIDPCDSPRRDCKPEGLSARRIFAVPSKSLRSRHHHGTSHRAGRVKSIPHSHASCNYVIRGLAHSATLLLTRGPQDRTNSGGHTAVGDVARHGWRQSMPTELEHIRPRIKFWTNSISTVYSSHSASGLSPNGRGSGTPPPEASSLFNGIGGPYVQHGLK